MVSVKSKISDNWVACSLYMECSGPRFWIFTDYLISKIFPNRWFWRRFIYKKKKMWCISKLFMTSACNTFQKQLRFSTFHNIWPIFSAIHFQSKWHIYFPIFYALWHKLIHLIVCIQMAIVNEYSEKYHFVLVNLI